MQIKTDFFFKQDMNLLLLTTYGDGVAKHTVASMQQIVSLHAVVWLLTQTHMYNVRKDLLM
jgi:hypothetical protein